jgi:hypothetical protein
VIFGDATRLRAKWAAASRVLADLEASGASYVDVRLPGRPAAGGLPAETIVPVAPAGATSTVPPGTGTEGTGPTTTDPAAAVPSTGAAVPPTSATVPPAAGTVPPATTAPSPGTVTQAGTTPPAPTTSPAPATPAPAPAGAVTDGTGGGAATAPSP